MAYRNIDVNIQKLCAALIIRAALNNMFTVKLILMFDVAFAGVRPYKCHMCDKAFTQRCSLESHGRKVHGLSFNFAYKERRSKVRIGMGLFFYGRQRTTLNLTNVLKYKYRNVLVISSLSIFVSKPVSTLNDNDTIKTFSQHFFAVKSWFADIY